MRNFFIVECDVLWSLLMHVFCVINRILKGLIISLGLGFGVWGFG